MVELVYASAALHSFTPKELTDLLAKARKNNQALGVSGLLLYHGGSFLQVLEGEEPVVDALFEKIAKDPRHNRCMVIKRSPIQSRRFADWSMGFVEVTGEVARKLEGFNSFFQKARIDLSGEAERLTKILGEFRSGQWRQHVS